MTDLENLKCPCGSNDIGLMSLIDDVPNLSCDKCGLYMSFPNAETLLKYWNRLSLSPESPVSSVGDVFTMDGITYKILTDSTVQVGDGTNPAISISQISCVIPATVSNGGTSYTVTSIGDRAFQYCYGLTSVTLPNSVTNLGDCAFDGCACLTSVTLPDSVTSIGDYAFYDCSDLTSVVLPASLTSIGDSVFFGCSELTSVTLPESLTSIGEDALCNCSQLVSIYYLGVKEPAIFGGAFIGGPSARILYVPNATGGFTADKWGAAKVVYGTVVGGAGSGDSKEVAK